MKLLEFFLSWPIIVTGIVASLFYGIYAINIFFPKDKVDGTKNEHLSWKIHQFWLNFLGSALGWTILYYLLKRVDYLEKLGRNDYYYDISFLDIFSVFIAFVGITGFLPMTIVGLINSISTLAQKIIETIGKYISK